MIPIYEALITDFDEGISKISLVDMPAVESNWLAFKDNKVQPKFAIQDEEQHIIYGVLMRADYPIYRRDSKLGEYYIQYSKETIAKMAEKMMMDETHNHINLMHMDGTDVTGVNLIQLFIKDSVKGVSPIGFEDIEEGSLFAVYKVQNPEIWKMVKDGTFMGFSLEGCFTIEKIKNNNSHKFMKSLKQKLAKLLMEFGEIKTDGGMLIWEGDEDLKAGDVVVNENDEAIADGDYTTEDGKVITVKDGAVSEIKDAEAEVAPEEMEDEAPVEEPAAEEPAEPEYDAKAEIEALKAEIEAIKAQLAEIANKPAAEPIAEEFEKVKKPAFNSALADAVRKIR